MTIAACLQKRGNLVQDIRRALLVPGDRKLTEEYVRGRCKDLLAIDESMQHCTISMFFPTLLAHDDAGCSAESHLADAFWCSQGQVNHYLNQAQGS